MSSSSLGLLAATGNPISFASERLTGYAINLPELLPLKNMEPVLCAGVILCDRIIREDKTGKYSLIGCFNNANVPMFPVMTPPCYIMVMLTNFKGQFETMDVALRLEQPSNGHVLFSTISNVKLAQPVTLTGTEVIEIPYQIPSFMLPAPGVYYYVVLVNNEVLGKRPFHVTAITTGQIPKTGE